MQRIVIEVSDDIAGALDLTAEALGEELSLVAAVKLYELGRLSSGAAAALAGIPRVEFLSRLQQYGVDALQLSEQDLDEEARLA